MVNHTSSLTVTIILMEESLSLSDTNVPMVTSQDPLGGARSLHRGRRRRDKESQGASTRTRAAHPVVVFLNVRNVHALTSVLHIESYVYIYMFVHYMIYIQHTYHIYIYACVCVSCTFSLSSKSRTWGHLPMSELPGDLVTVDGHPAALIQVETKSMSCPAPWWNS